jgi:hypothetical protein
MGTVDVAPPQRAPLQASRRWALSLVQVSGLPRFTIVDEDHSRYGKRGSAPLPFTAESHSVAGPNVRRPWQAVAPAAFP